MRSLTTLLLCLTLAACSSGSLTIDAGGALTVDGPTISVDVATIRSGVVTRIEINKPREGSW